MFSYHGLSYNFYYFIYTEDTVGFQKNQTCNETLCCPSEIQGDKKRTLFYDENVYKIIWDHTISNSPTEKCIKRAIACYNIRLSFKQCKDRVIKHTGWSNLAFTGVTLYGTGSLGIIAKSIVHICTLECNTTVFNVIRTMFS